MAKTRDVVFHDLIQLLTQLAEDSGEWAEDGIEISEETCLLGDMNWRSINLVVIASQMQEMYGQQFPFTDLFEEARRRDVPDITVREWIDFIYEHLDGGPEQNRVQEAER